MGSSMVGNQGFLGTYGYSIRCVSELYRIRICFGYGNGYGNTRAQEGTKEFPTTLINGLSRVDLEKKLEEGDIRVGVVWQKPKNGWVKVNFDGASKGKLGPSGAGFISQDWNGDILAIGARILVSGTNNEGEVQVALWGVRMVQQLYISCLHLEGDSQIIVNAIMKGEAASWKINKYIQLI